VSDLHAARNERRRELRQHLTARRSLVELLTHPSVEDPAREGPEQGQSSANPPRRRLKLYRED